MRAKDMTGEGFGKAEEKASGLGKTLGKFALAGGAALALVGYESVKMAGDFQASTVRLVTSAGETTKNLDMVRQGILKLAVDTGTSVDQLSKGMYMIESAGFHAGAGLAVLKAAAQGARAEGADLAEVANAVTSGLNAYGLSAAHATAFTNEMVATVGQGKMTMQDLASSLSAVLPIAAAAHISFAQVGGALATMTSMGMSAQQGTQDLANLIRSLLHPSGVASAEMRALGLNAITVQHNLGRAGLTGTLQVFTEAILANTRGGNVMVNYMRSMTPAAQSLARQILAGSITMKQLHTAVKGLNPEQAKLISLFENAATSATGLKQSYAGAMAALTGGATGLNVALMITGKHMGTFQDNVKAISAAAQGAGQDVNGWGLIQSTFNFKLAQLGEVAQTAGITLGNKLLPVLTAFLGWVVRNQKAVETTAAVIGILIGVLGVYVGVVKVVVTATKAWKDATMAVKAVMTGMKAGVHIMLDFASGFRNADAAASAFSGTAGTMGGNVRSAFNAIGSASKAAWSSVVSGISSAVTAVREWTIWSKLAALATRAWTAVQAAFNAVMDANPIALVILAIAALVAGVILAYQHVGWFRDLVNTAGHDIAVAFDWIRHAAAVTFDWIRDHWRLILAILLGPVGLAVDAITAHWHTIMRWASITIDFIRTHWRLVLAILLGPVGIAVDLIVKYWRQIMSDLSQVVSFIRSAWSAVYQILVGPVEQAWNTISGIVSTIKSAFSGVGGAVSSVAHFFGMAHGGIAGAAGGGPRGGFTMVGEYGPELVRLPYGSQVYSNAQSAGMLGGGGGGGTMQLELVGGGDDLLIRWLRNAIRIRGGNVQTVLGTGGP